MHLARQEIGVDGRNADLLPRQMHLKTAKVLSLVAASGERPRKAAKVLTCRT